MDDYSRRYFLTMASTLSLTVISGCSNLNSINDRSNPTEQSTTHSSSLSPTIQSSPAEESTSAATDTPSPTDTPEDTPTETETETEVSTPERELQNFNFSVNPETVDLPSAWKEEHNLEDFSPTASVEATGSENLEDVEITLNDETVQTWTETGTQISQNTSIGPEELETGENEIAVDLGYQWNGQTTHDKRTETVQKNTPEKYVADIVNTEGDHLNDYQTPLQHDQHTFNQQELDQRRQEWNQTIIYNGFINKLENNQDLEPNKYHTTSYPNAEGEYGKGHWDLESFQETSEFTEILDWIDTAVKVETFHQYDGPPSGHADEMAASAEKAINQIHPEAETRAGAIYNPEIEVGGSHGTMIFYDESGDSGWWHVDTTSERIVKPQEAQLNRRDVWSPFTELDTEYPENGGFHKGESQVENLTYEEKSESARNALMNIVAAGGIETDLKYDKTLITDEWLESAYDHIRDDGEIDPILEPLEQMVYTQVESDEYVGIYGDNLENTRICIGDEEIYNKVMENPEVMTADKIENILETTAA